MRRNAVQETHVLTEELGEEGVDEVGLRGEVTEWRNVEGYVFAG